MRLLEYGVPEILLRATQSLCLDFVSTFSAKVECVSSGHWILSELPFLPNVLCNFSEQDLKVYCGEAVVWLGNL